MELSYILPKGGSLSIRRERDAPHPDPDGIPNEVIDSKESCWNYGYFRPIDPCLLKCIIIHDDRSVGRVC